MSLRKHQLNIWFALAFSKLISEEKYVVALFCAKENTERCEEFEGELTGIREAPS